MSRKTLRVAAAAGAAFLAFLAFAAVAGTFSGCGDKKPTNPPVSAPPFQVAYVGIGPGTKYDIKIINSDGTGARNLTNSSQWNEMDPFFSYDGRKIVFSSDEGGPWSEIWVMDSDGTGRQQLTSGDWVNAGPAFSPDGSKIVFNRSPGSSPALTDIHVMNADGSNVARLTDHPESDVRPRFSPDGSQIVFTSYRDGNFEVYVMNADGSNQTNVTNNPAADHNPTYSPGGAILFASTRQGGFTFDLYTLNGPVTGGVSDAQDDWPCSSPGGGKIVFSASRVNGILDLFITPEQGGQAINLTNSPGDSEYNPTTTILNP